MSLQNIIKSSQAVWELWPVQDIGFSGDKNITKKRLDLVDIYQLAKNNKNIC